MSKRLVSAMLRVLVALSLLCWLLWKLDPQEIWIHVQIASPWLLCASAAVFGATQVTNVWRWRVLLRPHGAALSWRQLTHAWFCGLPFNTILPGAAGGDAAKVYFLVRERADGFYIAASVLVQRFLGIAVLGVLAAGLAVALWQSAFTSLTGPTALAGLTFLGLGFLPLWRPARHWVVGCLRRVPWKRLRTFAVRLEDNLSRFSLGSRHVQGALLISALNHGISITAYAVLAWALGLELHYTGIATIYVASMASTLVPITVGGLGLREAAVATVIGRYGYDAAAGVALSLCWFALSIAWSLPGLWLLLRRPVHAPHRQTSE